MCPKSGLKSGREFIGFVSKSNRPLNEPLSLNVNYPSQTDLERGTANLNQQPGSVAGVNVTQLIQPLNNPVNTPGPVPGMPTDRV